MRSKKGREPQPPIDPRTKQVVTPNPGHEKIPPVSEKMQITAKKAASVNPQKREEHSRTKSQTEREASQGERGRGGTSPRRSTQTGQTTATTDAGSKLSTKRGREKEKGKKTRHKRRSTPETQRTQ